MESGTVSQQKPQKLLTATREKQRLLSLLCRAAQAPGPSRRGSRFPLTQGRALISCPHSSAFLTTLFWREQVNLPCQQTRCLILLKSGTSRQGLCAPQPLATDPLWTPTWTYLADGECLVHRSGSCCLLPAANRQGNEHVTSLSDPQKSTRRCLQDRTLFVPPQLGPRLDLCSIVAPFKWEQSAQGRHGAGPNRNRSCHPQPRSLHTYMVTAANAPINGASLSMAQLRGTLPN